jgi:MFS superfamily sulfate permease-like transporter
MHIYFLEHIYEANLLAVGVSTITLILLAINSDIIKPRLSKICRVPVPMELIVVVIGTLLSYLMGWHSNYGVPVVGKIPPGIPFPEFPNMDMFRDAIIGSIAITIVIFANSYSMAKILAHRVGYTVDANQELLAQVRSKDFQL